MSAMFWTAALLLAATAWAALWAGTRLTAHVDPLPGRANVQLLDEQLAALRADATRGAIDPAAYRQGRTELERRLLDEATVAARRAGPGRSPRTVVALMILVPALAAAGYLRLGNPAALALPAAAAPAEPDVSAEDVQAMVDTLAQRMRSRPPGQADDLPGWVMLARSLAALQRFDAAAEAYERAVDLAPNDASLLADLADVLAMRNGRSGPPHADDRSGRLIARALELDPRDPKALALAGSAAFERHDTAAAIDFWRRARELVPAGSEFAAGLDQSLAEARGVSAGSTAPSTTAVASASVHGQVRLAPTLAARVAPGDTVFIYARAAHGPPMPLAILRRTAGDLPLDFTLDDSLAMAPDWRLSQVREIVVGARVSRSGNAMPQPGDLLGQVETVAGSGALSIKIDTVVP